MKFAKSFTIAALSLASLFSISACSNTDSKTANAGSTGADRIELLNVSYDVSRDFYKQFNELFIEHYKTSNPNITVSIKQSHGGSSKQALSVANGLAADVVTMNQNSDIELLVTKGLIENNWQDKLDNKAVPFTSSTVFLVRKGNPKAIKDWADLTRQDVQIILPSPKTSGNGRYAFLAAYGYGLHTFNNDTAQTDAFVKTLLGNVAIFDGGARAATTTFTQRSIGDVLITPENEANHIAHQLNHGEFEVVYPSYTVATENPVAVVDRVTTKKGSEKVAHDYLAYLYSDAGQELAAQLYLRPSNPNILSKYQDRFPAITTFLVNDVFGSWDDVMTTYFADGAKFDQLALQK